MIDTNKKGNTLNDNPLTDLVASNVLNLIAIHGNLQSTQDFDNIKLETPLDDLGIDSGKKKEIFNQFEKALGTVYVGGDKYNFVINTKLEDICTIADIIKAILEAMQDIIKKVSE